MSRAMIMYTTILLVYVVLKCRSGPQGFQLRKVVPKNWHKDQAHEYGKVSLLGTRARIWKFTDEKIISLVADVSVNKYHCNPLHSACLAHKAELLSVFHGWVKLSGISQTKIHEVTQLIETLIYNSWSFLSGPKSTSVPMIPSLIVSGTRVSNCFVTLLWEVRSRMYKVDEIRDWSKSTGGVGRSISKCGG